MDAVVFEKSPMATYLEGQGNDEETWDDAASTPSASSDRPSYAPHGLARLRGSLPAPLKIRSPFGRNIISGKEPATSNGNQSLAQEEQFLEQYRYVLVASQLLDDQISTAHHRRSGVTKANLPTPPQFEQSTESPTFSVVGASVAALTPFPLAILYKFVALSSSSSAGVLLVACVGGLIFVGLTVAGWIVYSRWKFAKEVRHATIRHLSELVTASQALDTGVTSALNFIQEVEIVSRGYDITTPLPPISRLEERVQQRRCVRLRREVASSLNDLCHQYIEAHRALLPYAPEEVVEQYHDIYDISRRDFQEVGLLSPQTVPEDLESLKSLKAAFAKQFVSRKIVLCDLLAFSANHNDPEEKRWPVAIEESRRLTSSLSKATSKINDLLQAEQDPVPETESNIETLNESTETISTPAKKPSEGEVDVNKANLARLTSLSQGIRTLNAKMHLFKEQATEVLEERSPSDVNGILSRQFDSVGTDLKNLLAEWDRGKQLMILQADGQRTSTRFSNRFSKTPISPVQSLGGSTAYDGSPSDALRKLNGEEDSDRMSPEQEGSDEEIFEAISLPKQSSTLSREERLAKMKEDRLKRALVQEKQDASTNMLRELETVIKHRPRGRTSMRLSMS